MILSLLYCIFLLPLLCCKFGIVKNYALFQVNLFSLKFRWCKENDIYNVWFQDYKIQTEVSIPHCFKTRRGQNTDRRTSTQTLRFIDSKDQEAGCCMFVSMFSLLNIFSLFIVLDNYYYLTGRYSQLFLCYSSSCGGLQPVAKAFYAVFVYLRPFLVFSSNISNF